MNESIETLKGHARQLGLSSLVQLAGELIEKAESEQIRFFLVLSRGTSGVIRQPCRCR